MPALQIHLFTPETNPGADALYLVEATGSSPGTDRKNPGGAIRATREPVRAPVIGRSDGRRST